MPKFRKTIAILVVLFTLIQCKKKQNDTLENSGSEMKYAKSLQIITTKNYTLVSVVNPWPNAKKSFTYLLHKKDFKIPDSLQHFQAIQIPIQSVVVTSTTHIPALEALNVENSLIAFPGLNYISSEKTRARIDAGKVREIGKNQSMNTEVLIDLKPDVIIGFGIDNDKKTYANLEKSGLQIMYNGDWTEESPLGKAEWIKFFGALYDKQEQANQIFASIEKEYSAAKNLLEEKVKKPTVLAGAIYNDQWYLPQGSSWAAYFLKDAKGDYLWKDSKGAGSLSLSFETVLEKGKDADFWIGPGQFTSIKEMLDANENYKYFKAIQNKNVYSFNARKGKTGGTIYYEMASNRPDLVLKDLIKILHPEVLPNYELYFFEKLN